MNFTTILSDAHYLPWYIHYSFLLFGFPKLGHINDVEFIRMDFMKNKMLTGKCIKYSIATTIKVTEKFKMCGRNKLQNLL